MLNIAIESPNGYSEFGTGIDGSAGHRDWFLISGIAPKGKRMRIFHSTFILLTACAVSAWAVPSVSAAPPVHELKLKKTNMFPFGTSAAVHGRVAAKGVRLILRKLSVNQPIMALLTAKEGEGELTFKVYKRNWNAPRLEGKTGKAGKKIFRFRSGDHAAFEITGKTGSYYQLVVWVGPVVERPQPWAFVPMSTYKAKTPTGKATAASPAPPATAAKDGGSDMFLYILIIVVIILLSAIIFLMYRGQLGKTKSMVLLLALGLTAVAPEISAQQTEPNVGSPPQPMSAEEASRRTSDAVRQIYDTLGDAPATGNAQIDSLVAQIRIGISLLEQAGFIDPREAAVHPNYTPDGMPPLPSRCYEDRSGKCRECFENANEGLTKWRRLLEDLWIIYKQTMLEAGRIIELADAATGLSPLASFAWKVQKLNPNDPVNKSKAKFFAEYDGAYAKLIKRLNDSVIAVGKCERDNYNDQDWYPRYGLPFYLFMTDRYKRK